MVKNELVVKVKDIVVDFFHHWKTPDATKKNEVSNKELVAFCVGGMGVKSVGKLDTYIQLTGMAGLAAFAYGLNPTNLLILFIISMGVSIVKAPLASWLIDNTHTRIGKFRPWLVWAAIPVMVGILGVVFAVPVHGTQTEKMVALAVFYNIYFIGNQLYNNAYQGISQIISPSTGERNKILSISEFIANLGPSIVQLFFPIFAGLFAAGGKKGMEMLISYQVLLPIFCGFSIILGLVVMIFTKERVIYVKQTKQKVKFSEGFKLVCTNRDFNIVVVSKFFGAMRGFVSMMVTWVALYWMNSDAMAGIIPTIVSLACTPGMLLAPLIMKHMGNGRGNAFTYGLEIAALLIMLFTFKFSPWIFVIALFLFNLATGGQYVMQTAVTADALDEIQLYHNQRIEGFAQNFQQAAEMAGNIVGQVILVALYPLVGLVAAANGEMDWSMLTSSAIREPLFMYIILIGIGASVLSGLPFFFCKMTRKRHELIISELERRQQLEQQALALATVGAGADGDEVILTEVMPEAAEGDQVLLSSIENISPSEQFENTNIGDNNVPESEVAADVDSAPQKKKHFGKDKNNKTK